MTTIRRITSHTLMALAEGALIALLVVGLVAGTAFAGGKGNTSTSATLDLVMVADLNGNQAPNYGDTITFQATTSASKPEVGFRCYQGATMVFDGYVSLYDSWLNQDLTLVSSKWDQARDGDCTARLFYYNKRAREVVLTTMKVTVQP